MKNWMDLNGDGKIDGAEMMFAGEMLCTIGKNMKHYLEMPGILRMTQKMILTKIFAKEADLYETEFIWI